MSSSWNQFKTSISARVRLLFSVILAMYGIRMSVSEFTFDGSAFMVTNWTENHFITTSRERIQITFKTIQPYSSLLYSDAQSNNGLNGEEFLFLYIGEERLKLAMKFGNVTLNESVEQATLSDGLWHEVSLNRSLTKSREGKIILKLTVAIDGLSELQQAMPVNKSHFLLERIILGSQAISRRDLLPKAELTKLQKLRGCVKQSFYEDDTQQINLLSQASRNGLGMSLVGGSSLDQNCSDKLFSQVITFHWPNYLSHDFLYPAQRDNQFQIKFSFRTFKSNCLIFLLDLRRMGQNHFILFELKENYLYTVFNLNSSVIRQLLTPVPQSDGQNHSVVFSTSKSSSKISIVIDNLEMNSLSVGHTSTDRFDLDVNNADHLPVQLYIGGVSYNLWHQYPLPSEAFSVMTNERFVGCLSHLQINHKFIDLPSIWRSNGLPSGISIGCRGSGKLSAGLCSNGSSSPGDQCHGGLCLTGWSRAYCDCGATEFAGASCTLQAPKVVFNGSQYVTINFGHEMESSAEYVSLRFLTLHKEGMLFRTSCLYSSARDFMEVQIIDARLRIIFDFGSGHKIFKLNEVVSDYVWHSIRITRDNLSLLIQLDHQTHQYNLHPAGDLLLTFNSLNVGGYSSAVFSSSNVLSFSRMTLGMLRLENLETVPPEFRSKPFIGKMMHFVFNGVDYFEQPNLPNIEANAKLVQTRFIRSNNAPARADNKMITFKTATCYIQMKPLALYKDFRLSFEFKTTQATGVILINWSTSGDYLLFELVDGFVEFAFNMGRGIQRNRSKLSSLADNRWHKVEILRQPKNLPRNIIEFRVDNEPREEKDAAIFVMFGTKARNFNLNKNLFIGGFPRKEMDKWRERINSRSGYQGCLANLIMNNKAAVKFLKTLDSTVPPQCSHEVVNGCLEPSEVCSPSKCRYGGQCIQQWTKLKCNCQMTTFTGERCNEVATTIKFSKTFNATGYARVAFLNFRQLRNTTKDEIALGIQTAKAFGTILYVEAASASGDFLHVYLSSGELVVRYNMGGKINVLEAKSKIISDNFYHRIAIVRKGKNLQLSIDAIEWYLEPEGKQGTHFNQQKSIWLGNYPGLTDGVNFEGTMSGTFFNRLYLNDIVLGIRQEHNLKISRFGHLNHVPNFTANVRFNDGSDDSNHQMQANMGKVPRKEVNNNKGNEIIKPVIKCPNPPRDDEECRNPYNEKDIIVGKVKPIIPRQKNPDSSYDGYYNNQATRPPYDQYSGNDSPNDRKDYNFNTVSDIRSAVDSSLPIDNNFGGGQNSRSPLFNINNLTLWLILALLCGILVAILLVICFIYRCRRQRDSGSYQVALYSETDLKSTPLETNLPLFSRDKSLDYCSNGTYPGHRRSSDYNKEQGSATTVKKKNGRKSGRSDVKEWYV